MSPFDIPMALLLVLLALAGSALLIVREERRPAVDVYEGRLRRAQLQTALALAVEQGDEARARRLLEQLDDHDGRLGRQIAQG